ncbi:hypothetical protein, partial [Bacillus cereus]
NKKVLYRTIHEHLKASKQKKCHGDLKNDEIKVLHTPDFFLLFIRAPIQSKFNRKRNDANKHHKRKKPLSSVWFLQKRR